MLHRLVQWGRTAWEALFQTIELFRGVSIEVADQLGYVYPEDMNLRIVAYVQKLQRLDRPSAPSDGRS